MPALKDWFYYWDEICIDLVDTRHTSTDYWYASGYRSQLSQKSSTVPPGNITTAGREAFEMGRADAAGDLSVMDRNQLESA